MDIVGPIHLEDPNGQPLCDVHYEKHSLLRPFQVAYGGYWYEQNRQDAQGIWYYRQRPGLPGTMADDPAIQPMPEPVTS